MYKTGQYEAALQTLVNASELPAFKDQPSTSSFQLFKKQCAEAIEQNEALPFNDPLRKMFEEKFKWYESMGADLSNVKLRFEKGGTDPYPGLSVKRDFGI